MLFFKMAQVNFWGYSFFSGPVLYSERFPLATAGAFILALPSIIFARHTWRLTPKVAS